MAQERITIRKPDDLHIHLRQDAPLTNYAADAAVWFKRVLPMPNTIPAIDTPAAMIAYRHQIEEAAPGVGVVSVFKIDAKQTPEDIRAFKKAGAYTGKYYPQGATTNSEGGDTQWEGCYPVFQAMEEEGIILSLHGEEPESYSLDREKDFLPKLDDLARRFPRLKVILEHVSSAEGVEKILSLPENFAATITAHHLKYTLDNVIGGGANVHLFCKPVVKSPADRAAVRKAAFSGNPKFFFGSDSAPHLREKKEKGAAAAGIYSIPVAVPVVVGEFEKGGALDRVEDFLSRFGAEFYGLPLNEERITLVREEWTVPGEYHGVVPMMAQRKVYWKREEKGAQ